jgi:hypothetical protein
VLQQRVIERENEHANRQPGQHRPGEKPLNISRGEQVRNAPLPDQKDDKSPLLILQDQPLAPKSVSPDSKTEWTLTFHSRKYYHTLCQPFKRAEFCNAAKERRATTVVPPVSLAWRRMMKGVTGIVTGIAVTGRTKGRGFVPPRTRQDDM